MEQDETYMRRCLDIAACGKGFTAPNPMVGAVVVCDGKIIGEGFHARCGGPHAEVEAIRSVRRPELLERSTLYVSLEPCCHYGKTPPCTELILEHRIPRVVVACVDANPSVGGKGIARLRENGCELRVGVLEKEARALNRRFFTFQEKKRPYILLKWAQTLDGFMDIDRSGDKAASSYWITNEEMRYRVHAWRAEEAAVMVGANTVLNDNPQLNLRYAAGQQPLRIALFGRLPAERGAYRLFDRSQPTLVFNTEYGAEEENLTFVKIPDFGASPAAAARQDLSARDPELAFILDELYRRQVQSVMVEGGRRLLDRFIASGLWDEARVLIGNRTFGRGLPAPVLPQSADVTEQVGDNVQCTIYN